MSVIVRPPTLTWLPFPQKLVGMQTLLSAEISDATRVPHPDGLWSPVIVQVAGRTPGSESDRGGFESSSSMP